MLLFPGTSNDSDRACSTELGYGKGDVVSKEYQDVTSWMVEMPEGD